MVKGDRLAHTIDQNRSFLGTTMQFRPTCGVEYPGALQACGDRDQALAQRDRPGAEGVGGGAGRQAGVDD